MVRFHPAVPIPYLAMNEDPYVDPLELRAANERHDREHPDRTPIRPGFNPAIVIRRGMLTDKKIARYAKAGWYSPDFQQARRERMAKKQRRREDGNFVQSQGRLIYCP